jgi:hypothetical protein
MSETNVLAYFAVASVTERKKILTAGDAQRPIRRKNVTHYAKKIKFEKTQIIDRDEFKNR